MMQYYKKDVTYRWLHKDGASVCLPIDSKEYEDKLSGGWSGERGQSGKSDKTEKPNGDGGNEDANPDAEDGRLRTGQAVENESQERNGGDETEAELRDGLQYPSKDGLVNLPDDEIRAMARAAGINNYWNALIENLIEKLSGGVE
jgi:hypothetical protein